MKHSSAIQMLRLSELIAKGSEHALERILRNPGVFKDLLEAAEMREGDNRFHGQSRWEIRKALGLSKYPAPEVFQISVDVNPSVSIEDLIGLGKYQYVSAAMQESIKNNLFARAEKSGKVKISILHFDRDIISYNSGHEMLEEVDPTTIEKEMQIINCIPFSPKYRPLNIDELLAVGSQKPEIQKKFPLVAYGLFSGQANVALDDSGPRPEHRRLVEYNFDCNAFYDFYRILAVET